jgi:hypothetical protein
MEKAKYADSVGPPVAILSITMRAGTFLLKLPFHVAACRAELGMKPDIQLPGEHFVVLDHFRN